MNRPPKNKKPQQSSKWDKYDLNNPANQVDNNAKPPPLPKLKKIAISGTACQGKSTLIRDMLTRWPMLSTPEKTYRDIIKEKGLTINKFGTAECQEIILNALVDQAMESHGGKKVVLDRCPLDNLVYSIWLNAKNPEAMPDEAVAKAIKIVRESVKFLDAIFFIPLTSVHKVPLVEDTLRDADPEYIEEIDNIFKEIIKTQQKGIDVFLPIEDCPPIIEVFGDRQTRIKMLELYIDDKCDFVGCDDSVMNELASQTQPEYTPEVILKPSK